MRGLNILIILIILVELFNCYLFMSNEVFIEVKLSKIWKMFLINNNDILMLIRIILLFPALIFGVDKIVVEYFFIQ